MYMLRERLRSTKPNSIQWAQPCSGFCFANCYLIKNFECQKLLTDCEKDSTKNIIWEPISANWKVVDRHKAP